MISPFRHPLSPISPAAWPREQFLVDPRLVVLPVEMRRGDELEQVVVAGIIPGEEREMIRRVAPVGRFPVGMRSRRHIDLAADDRLHALLLRFLEKFDRAVKHPVIGHGERGHSVLPRLFHRFSNPHRAIERRILGVQVEMNERVGGHGRRIYAIRRPPRSG